MSIPEHDRLCEQANQTDLDVRGCICDWISAAEQRTEKRIIKLIIDNDVIGSEWWIRLIKGEGESK